MTLPALQASDAREDRGCAGVSSLRPDLALPEERRLANQRLPGSGPRAVWTASPSALSCGKVRERARACMPGAFGPGVAPAGCRPSLPCPRSRGSSSGFLCSRAKLPPNTCRGSRARGLAITRDQEGQGLTSASHSGLLTFPPRFVFHKPPVCFCGVLFRVPKLYPTWKTPRFPQGNFSFQVEVTFLGPSSWRNSAQGRAWLLCTEPPERVCGLPRRDDIVTCVDIHPWSGALCGLSLFICEPDLPIRGGGGCCERETV